MGVRACVWNVCVCAKCVCEMCVRNMWCVCKKSVCMRNMCVRTCFFGAVGMRGVVCLSSTQFVLKKHLMQRQKQTDKQKQLSFALWGIKKKSTPKGIVMGVNYQTDTKHTLTDTPTHSHILYMPLTHPLTWKKKKEKRKEKGYSIGNSYGGQFRDQCGRRAPLCRIRGLDCTAHLRQHKYHTLACWASSTNNMLSLKYKSIQLDTHTICGFDCTAHLPHHKYHTLAQYTCIWASSLPSTVCTFASRGFISAAFKNISIQRKARLLVKVNARMPAYFLPSNAYALHHNAYFLPSNAYARHHNAFSSFQCVYFFIIMRMHFIPMRMHMHFIINNAFKMRICACTDVPKKY